LKTKDLFRLALLAGLFGAGAPVLAGEAILQYFNTSWAEITRRIPELAETGYDALWLPPPTKAAGGAYSVGYDPYDRFDLGDRDQCGTIATRYGTATELLQLVRTAHRFGLRVYFDNVMAHDGGPWPSGAPGTLGPTGMVPEDYHLIRTSGTTYSSPPSPPTNPNEWETLNRTWFGADIAQESPNDSFGYTEGDDYPKWIGVRHPNNPEFYLDTDLPITVVHGGSTTTVYTFANKEPWADAGYTNNSGVFVSNAVGNGRFDWQDTNANGQHNAGEPCESFTDTGLDPSRADRRTAAWGYGDGVYNMGNPVAEDVNSLLFRSVRRFLDLTRCDGFRLDAVKHGPAYFFGKMDEPKDSYNWGFGGQIQEQFNISRGFSDWDNHRDTVFNNVQARDDAMLFGEHMGEPPSKSSYVAAGMRLADDGYLNAVKGNIGNNLEGMDNPYYGVSTPGDRVIYLMSHDNNYIWGGDREQAYAVTLTREGLPIIYTDGYNQSGAPDWFPKPAEVPFLGQFGSSYLPNLLDINRHFGWGYQSSRWSAWDYTSWARYDPDCGANDHGVTMVFMLAKNYISGWPLCNIDAMFPEGARLVNYAYHGGAFWAKVVGGKLKNMDGSSIYVPPGQYFVFSWRTPQMPLVWGEGLQQEMQPITIYENGVKAGTMTCVRTDGRNGDPAFNPYGLPDTNTSDYSYSITLPRVTSATNLAFYARADGSAENILMKLDGGIDLNSQLDIVSQTPGTRDNPPALSQDRFLGYEQMKYVRRVAEKFAAQNVARNIIGSMGAETYLATIGAAGFTAVPGSGTNTTRGTAAWVYHEPTNQTDGAVTQFNPLPQFAAGAPVDVWVKVGYQFLADKVYLYYTTNGTNPEGSGGFGKGDTKVVEIGWDHNGAHDGTGVPDWWKGTLPAMPAGTTLRYKIGVYDDNAPSRFPWSDEDIAIRYRMETLFAITNFNAAAIPFYPDNDWGSMQTGLDEGYHILRTKCILGRASGDTPIYRQFNQTFYYDIQAPTGRIVTPAADGTALTGSSARVTARSDITVEEAWYRIDDSDPANDDSATGVNNGNNAWVKAIASAVPSPLPRGANEKEWSFNYVNLPTNGAATISIRLREVTSATNMALSDTAGHFTTLQRTVATGGNSVRLFIHSPSADGATVGVGSNLVAYFSQSLTNGLTDAQLRTCFTVSLNGVAQSNQLYTILHDVTAYDHALSFTLPNLYNGQPAYQHTLAVAFERGGYPSLNAQRMVYAAVNDDSNGDGIPDFWERQWNVPVGSIAPNMDSDGDGYLNIREYIANTNPFDSNDYLYIQTAWLMTNRHIGLLFDGKSNRYYYVWYTEDLRQQRDAWHLATPLTEPIEGLGRTNEFTDITLNRTNRYYQVEVRLP